MPPGGARGARPGDRSLAATDHPGAALFLGATSGAGLSIEAFRSADLGLRHPGHGLCRRARRAGGEALSEPSSIAQDLPQHGTVHRRGAAGLLRSTMGPRNRCAAPWWRAPRGGRRPLRQRGSKTPSRVEILPQDVHPLDARYNVIQWVHRSTRGWSYGSTPDRSAHRRDHQGTRQSGLPAGAPRSPHLRRAQRHRQNRQRRPRRSHPKSPWLASASCRPMR